MVATMKAKRSRFMQHLLLPERKRLAIVTSYVVVDVTVGRLLGCYWDAVRWDLGHGWELGASGEWEVGERRVEQNTSSQVFLRGDTYLLLCAAKCKFVIHRSPPQGIHRSFTGHRPNYISFTTNTKEHIILLSIGCASLSLIVTTWTASLPIST